MNNRNLIRRNSTTLSFSKSIFRAYFKLIGPFHVLPNFIIIGAMKSGTTSLYYDICEHPCIVPAAYDEIGFFDSNFERGINWYKSLLPTVFQKWWINLQHQNFVTGEDTPFYFWKPYAAKRILQFLPNIKLIVLLRNPIDRAYSNYHDAVRAGNETLSFEESVKLEIKKLESINMTDTDNDVVSLIGKRTNIVKGIYADQMKIWLNLFSSKQILTLSSENFASKPHDALNEIFQFLNLPSYVVRNLQRRKVARNPPMQSETREFLIEYFKPHNERFYELTGKNFCWDD